MAKKRKPMVFSLGELFCGAGGLACGALAATSADGIYTMSHKWACDIEWDACKSYIRNITGGDISSVFCMDVRDLSIPNLGYVDALAFGFPCNSFSILGKHDGTDNDKYGQLYIYGVKVLERYQPKFFVAENVSGIKSTGAGKHFETILADLENAGYVLTPHMYHFEDYGVPQTRHRIIIVGIRKDFAEKGVTFRVPSPDPYKDLDITAGTALSNIADDAPNNEMPKGSELVKARLSYIKPGQNCWEAEMPEELRLASKVPFSTCYKKLDPALPAYTVIAAGGGGMQMYHWSDENRALTNRERARLQTFPDDFVFEGSYTSVRKQIGMAVPPQGSRIIFEAILNSFEGIKYPWVPNQW